LRVNIKQNNKRLISILLVYLHYNYKHQMMKITKQNTVAEVVAQNMGADQVFSKYKIDFCCGGGATLEIACKESGVEFEVLKKEIETIRKKISNPTI